MFSLIPKGQCNYFSLTLLDNCLIVSVKEVLTSPCWRPAEIRPFRPLPLTVSPEPFLLDLSHLACYIVGSGVNNSLLLQGLTSLKFINEFCQKPWVCRYRFCLPPRVLNLHQQPWPHRTTYLKSSIIWIAFNPAKCFMYLRVSETVISTCFVFSLTYQYRCFHLLYWLSLKISILMSVSGPFWDPFILEIEGWSESYHLSLASSPFLWFPLLLSANLLTWWHSLRSVIRLSKELYRLQYFSTLIPDI